MIDRRTLATYLLTTAAAASVPHLSRAATAVDARAIAKQAYLYAFAMMENYQTWRTQAVDKNASAYVGGFNVYRHYSEPFTPDNKDIVTPNNDTPYSWAWLDLRVEPMVVSVPAVPKDRYYVMQWIDLFTQNFAYIGVRSTGFGGVTSMAGSSSLAAVCCARAPERPSELMETRKLQASKDVRRGCAAVMAEDMVVTSV